MNKKENTSSTVDQLREAKEAGYTIIDSFVLLDASVTFDQLEKGLGDDAQKDQTGKA